MLRGIYTAAAGMLAQEVSQNVLANNLANTGTPGFRAGQVAQGAFPQELLFGLGPLGTGTVVDDVVRDTTPGAPIPSEAPLAASLQGDGYFVVNTPQGVRLTRDGEFRLAQDGTLVTLAGDPVAGVNGPLRGTPGAGDLRVTTTGQVYQGQQLLGQLKVAQVPAGAQVVPEAGNLWRLEAQGQPLQVAAAALPNAQAAMLPGMVESANVNVVDAMTQLVAVARAYEASQRALRAEDQTLQLAVTEVGRV